MAINIHPADALIHRLLQQQGNSSSRNSSSQNRSGDAPMEKVTISDQARNAAQSGKLARLESSLLQLYGPQGG